jgi:alpha-galactosidase
MLKISVIGAGSVVFTGRLMVDLCLTKSLSDCTVVLMDIDKNRLNMMNNLATKYVKEMNTDIHVKKTLNREEALNGADFVINTVKVGGYEPMEIERTIAEKHGYYRGLGDRVSDYYGGIGAFHQLKIFLNLAKDVEKNCPDAWLMQTANPVFEGTTLMSRETKAKVIGFCHGHFSYTEIAKALGVKLEDVEVMIAGFNHCIWLLNFLHKGENAYPMIDRWIEKKAEKYWKSDEYLNGPPWGSEQMSPAAVDMYRMYGVFPIGDTLRSASPWWYHTDLKTKQKWYGPTGGFDSEIGWSIYLKTLKETLEQLRAWSSDPNIALTKVYPPSFSGEQHIPFIDAIANNKKVQLQLNIPNKGAISGIPDDVVVEVPTLISGAGVGRSRVTAMPVGQLPKHLMLHVLVLRMLRMEQILQAFLEGDRKSLLLAIAEDHRTRSFEDARMLLEEELGQSWNSEAAKHYK